MIVHHENLQWTLTLDSPLEREGDPSLQKTESHADRVDQFALSHRTRHRHARLPRRRHRGNDLHHWNRGNPRRRGQHARVDHNAGECLANRRLQRFAERRIQLGRHAVCAQRLSQNLSRRGVWIDDQHAHSNQATLPWRCGDAFDRVVRHFRGRLECAAAIRRALHGHLAAHRLHQTFDNGQAEARAAGAARVGAVGLSKRIEDDRSFMRIDADSGIAHFEVQRQIGGKDCVAPDAHHHFALTCELDRVAYEIDQNLAQPKRIAPQPIRNAAVDGERNVQTLLRGSHAESLHRVGDQLANGEVHRLQLEAARFDLGEVEDVLDGRQERFGGAPGQVELLAPLRRGIAVDRQLQHSHDAVERRAHLVRDVRQELAFGLAGRLGTLLRLTNASDLLLHLADLLLRGFQRLIAAPCERCTGDEDDRDCGGEEKRNGKGEGDGTHETRARSRRCRMARTRGRSTSLRIGLRRKSAAPISRLRASISALATPVTKTAGVSIPF